MEHRVAIGSLLHGLKGADSAANGTVATADGSGNTVWKKLGAENIPDTSKVFSHRLLHVRNKQNSGTNNQTPYGNLTTKYATWYFGSDINTVVVNQISGASVASNTITLPAGTYDIKFEVYDAPSYSQAVLLKNSGGYAVLIKGIMSGLDGSGLLSGPAVVTGRFEISGSTDFKIGIYGGTDNTHNDQFGDAMSTGEDEVYLDARIWKVA